LPLMGLVLLLTACSSGPADRTPPAAPAAAAPQAATPVEPLTSPPQAAPAAEPSRASVALAAARRKSREEQKKFIADLILDGIFSHIELNEGVPRVHLRPAFRLLTLDDKLSYLAVVYAFAYPDDAGHTVALFDSVSGKQTGSFTQAGLQLREGF